MSHTTHDKKKGRKKVKKHGEASLLQPAVEGEPEDCEYEYVEKYDRYRKMGELVVDYKMGQDNEGECVTLAHLVYQQRMMYGNLAANGLVDPELKYVPYLYASENIARVQELGPIEYEQPWRDIPDSPPLPVDPDREVELEKAREHFRKLESVITSQIASIDSKIAEVHAELERELSGPDSESHNY